MIVHETGFSNHELDSINDWHIQILSSLKYDLPSIVHSFVRFDFIHKKHTVLFLLCDESNEVIKFEFDLNRWTDDKLLFDRVFCHVRWKTNQRINLLILFRLNRQLWSSSVVSLIISI